MWATIFPIPYSDGPCLLVNIWRKYLSYLFIYFFHSNYIYYCFVDMDMFICFHCVNSNSSIVGKVSRRAGE